MAWHGRGSQLKWLLMACGFSYSGCVRKLAIFSLAMAQYVSLSWPVYDLNKAPLYTFNGQCLANYLAFMCVANEADGREMRNH